MTGALREPLLHFFALGAALFALFALVDDTPPPADERIIAVTVDDVRRFAAEFEATWRRAPGRVELDQPIAQHVREGIHVREATALGLDEGDAVIRRRLQMKVEFLTAAGSQAVHPGDATLAAHLAARPERFTRAPRVAFEQILLAGGAGRAAVMEICASLNGGWDQLEVARPSLLPAALPASPPQVVDSTFGAGFFDALAGLPAGQWAGPVTSPLGRHLVRVALRQGGGLPPLAAIRERVPQDWRATRAAAVREARFAAMRARSRVTRTDAVEVLGR